MSVLNYQMTQKEKKKYVYLYYVLVKLSEKFENNLEIIGCTAIEDKL